MAKEELLEFRGVVTEVLPNAMFQVRLENDHVVLSHLAGRLKRNKITIISGDEVEVEMSTYDISKGRITYRHKAGSSKPTNNT